MLSRSKPLDATPDTLVDSPPPHAASITVDVNISRLDHTKWSLEVVDKEDNSIVWDGEFETDDEAYAEFLNSVETEGLDGVLRDTARPN